MPTELEVVNMSLALLDEVKIAALSDSNKAARLAHTHYAQVRRAELTRHPWAFAVTSASVTGTDLGTDEGTLNWQYTRPASALRVLPLTHNGEPQGIPITWRQVGDKILSDQETPLVIRYVQDVTDPDDWPPLFVDVVSTALALKLAIPLTQKLSFQELAAKAYQSAISEARRVKAFEEAGSYYDAGWGRWRGDNRYWRA